MSFSCLHIADVHFRGLSRHDEYRQSFEDLFRQARQLNPDIIYIGGDIVHSKTQGISPELIDTLSWWFTEMARIAPTHIILGNHDGLVMNKDRQDAISPIVSALDNPRLFLYKDSGIYPTGIPGYNWGVFSCFDEASWPKVKPEAGKVNIALFHGAVRGSLTDVDWSIEGEVEHTFFDGFDFAFLGDIHRQQYLDPENRIAYCGSTIQQNYGEDPGKGFLFWEIENKDSFTSTFHSIAHSCPFITIDWEGGVEKTLDVAEQAPDGARFRIRLSEPIPQAEIKQLFSALKEFKSAKEIVLKQDFDTEVGLITTPQGTFASEDLRDAKTHHRLMREFYKSSNITDDEWESLDDLVSRYIGRVSREESTTRNIKWSIRRMAFDNTFAYGKGNVIDFTKMSGITGLFGRNRMGKSSIPGSLMYGLFNTTDRGPIKNLHIINSRKGHCQVELDFNVNGVNYRAERQSVKHHTRRGDLHATTHLNLSKLNDTGDIIQDLNEEQRRETEKVLRRLVGTSDDFLMTSLASQGEMNTFIKHRATMRKEILTNFLDLGVFEKLLNMAKDDSAAIKGMLKSAPDVEWETLITEKVNQRRARTRKRSRVEKKLLRLRQQLQDYKILLATHKDKDLVTIDDVNQHEKELAQMKSRLADLDNDLKDGKSALSNIDERVERISKLKEQFPREELLERYDAQQSLEKSINNLQHDLEKERLLLKQQRRSIKKLDEVPCGDMFPTCKFIRDSHKNKKDISTQEQKVEDTLSQLKAAKRSVGVLLKENLSEKIERYEIIMQQESEILVEKSEASLRVHELTAETTALRSSVAEAMSQLLDMKLRIQDVSNASEVNELKANISSLNVEVNEVDAERMSLSESLGLLTSDLAKLREERDRYRDLIKQWRVYDLLMSAVSKKGIPLQIITSQLPVINDEVAKILQGVTGFTVELEADTGSNAMDVYINYGDSRRVIECASGMEKMMASLAIRVALINISSLPKTDLLIIDEGFGALDEMNVEACNRLLESLKKWFKNILVISHIDAVKDAVDNVLDITSKGKDAQVIFE